MQEPEPTFALTDVSGATQQVSFPLTADSSSPHLRRGASVFGQSVTMTTAAQSNMTCSLFGDVESTNSPPVLDSLPQRATSYEGKQQLPPPLLRGTAV